MKGSGVYFTWSKFFIRILIVFCLSPVFFLAGLALAIRDYWKYKKYNPQTLFRYVIDNLKTFSLTVGWFILGGFKTLKG